MQEVQEESVTQTITSKIGDLIKNTATCHVTMEKDKFVVGEPLKVLVDLDNSKVTKKVKSYKFKLQRNLEIKSGNNDNRMSISIPLGGEFKKSTEIYRVNEPGCGPKTTDQREFMITLPEVDPSDKVGSVANLHDNLVDLARAWTTSHNGSIFSI